jgi:hypothetical protein
VKSSSNRANRTEVLDQVPSKDIEIKTNTQRRVDENDLDTETENAILGDPDKKIEHDGTRNYAFDTDESEHIREMSMQEEEEDSLDDEEDSTRAIGIGGYDSDDSSESAVKCEASPVERHAETEENKWDAPEAKENGQDMPVVEESKKVTPLAEEEYNQDTREVVDKKHDTTDLVGNSVGNNQATEVEGHYKNLDTFKLVGNDQEENKRGIIRVERSEQENIESDDDTELVQIDHSQSAHVASKVVTADDIDSGMEHNAIQLVSTEEEDLKETVQENFEVSTANTRKKPAWLWFNDDPWFDDDPRNVV